MTKLEDLFNGTSVAASSNTEADEIILIADRSGSMHSIQEDAQGGINTFIADQKKEGSANLTFVEFDNEIDVVYNQTDIKNVSDYELIPRRSTALYDAIGFTLSNVEKIITTGKKIVVIVTDGGENSSQEWSQSKIFERIESLKKSGWDFLFLAANQDAMQTGINLGIQAGEIVNFASTSIGTRAAYGAASNYTTSLRAGVSKQATMDALDVEVEETEGLSK